MAENVLNDNVRVDTRNKQNTKPKTIYIGSWEGLDNEVKKNEDLEILINSGIIEDLKVLRDRGDIKWSDNPEKGSLPEIRDPRNSNDLKSEFLKPETENPDIDHEPARIYISTEENKTPFVSILFNGSREEDKSGTVPKITLKCSELRFGIRDKKICVLGFGTYYKPVEYFSNFSDMVKETNFRNIEINKK